MTALKAKVLAGKEKGQKVVCSLMLDEMSICKHPQYDGTKVLGYVDLGAGITDDSLPVATKARDVYMAASVNSNWKMPCSYFLVDTGWSHRKTESIPNKRLPQKPTLSGGEGGLVHI